MLDESKLPQKKYYRQRAHANPIAHHVMDAPKNPRSMDWSTLYPNIEDDKRIVRFADIGCGYGGLLMRLSPLYPDELMLGMEIRLKVSNFVKDKISALRCQHKEDQTKPTFANVACVRTNAMKYLPNYFKKSQLTKMFFLFPDPHFKHAKHKWRIISQQLLDEYAYVLCVGGIIYTITDVLEVHEWMVKNISEHPLFERIEEEEQAKDPIVPHLFTSTEEGQKVERQEGIKLCAIFRRKCNPTGMPLSQRIRLRNK